MKKQEYYLGFDPESNTHSLMMDPDVNCICPLRSPVVVQGNKVLNSPCTSNCTHFRMDADGDNKADVFIYCSERKFPKLKIITFAKAMPKINNQHKTRQIN